MSLDEVLYTAKPSLRRAYFFVVLCFSLLVFVWIKFDSFPLLNKVMQLAAAVVLALLGYAFLYRKMTTYTVTPQGVHSISGVFVRKSGVIPYARITNVVADQSLLELVLGLVNIHFDTAGSQEKEVTFMRLLNKDAEKVKEILKDKISKVNPVGDGT